MAWSIKKNSLITYPLQGFTLDNKTQNLLDRLVSKGIAVVSDPYAALVTALANNKEVVYDSFNRPDSTTLGNADTGQAWQTMVQTFGISGNQACFVASTPAGTRAFAAIDTGRANGIAQITASVMTGAVRLVFRCQDSSNFMQITTTSAGDSYNIAKVVSNSVTTLGTYVTTQQNGDTIKVVFNGDLIECYINNVKRITTNNGTFSTATLCGFGSNSAPSDRFDEFIFTEV